MINQSYQTNPPSIKGGTESVNFRDRGFRILDHLDKLTPDGGSWNKRTEVGSFYCPACGSKNFKPRQDGGYGTYGCECGKTDEGKRAIREAVSPSKWVKPDRPAQYRQWEYCDADGKPLVIVHRTDKGDGVRKINQSRADGRGEPRDVGHLLMPYRYRDCLDAMQSGQQVFWVEGEPCADALWGIGLAATTTIGGCGHYRSEQYRDLFPPGDRLVICPDRDKPGMKYAEQIAADYPQAKWLYAPPNDYYWRNLPDSKGADVADWILGDKADREIVLAAVCDRREFAAPPPAPTATNVVDHPTVRRSIDSDELRERLRAIAHSSPSGSEKRLQLAGLAKQFGCQSRELESIYAELEREMDLEEGMADAQNDLSALINARHASVPLSSVLPRKLADPLEQLAKWQNLKPENYLFSFLAGVSSLHRNGTELVIHQAMDFRVSPGLFVGIVAESSQKKSPIINASLKRPLGVLHREERKRHELAMEQWEAECSQIRQQQDKNAKLPDEPQKRVYRIDRTTGEAILRQATRQPEHGYIYNPDELKALFGSQNAYRKGRGSDEEDLLEFYDGNGGTILRADGVRDDVDCLNLAIAGSIQPGVLQKLIGEGDDSNGKWARFIFVHQPTTASSLPNDGGGVDLTNLLAGIYRTVDSAPAMEYRLSPQAFTRFQVAYNKLEQMRVNEPSQAMRAVWGKTAGRIGKLAMNLHAVQWAMSTDRPPMPSPTIELETLEAAIQLAWFAAQQIESLYCQFDDSDGNLAPHYLKVLELADRKGGWIKAKDIQLGFTRAKRPTPEVVRTWFSQLCEMGYGILDGEGRKLQFQKVDNGRQKVDGLSTAETATTKVSQVKVDKVDKVDLFPSTSMVDTSKDPSGSGRQKNTLSTASTCLPNDQNSYPESGSSVDNPSTEVSTFPKSSTVLPPDEKVDELVGGIRYTLKQPTAKEQRAQALTAVRKCNAGKWAIAYRLLSTDERLLVDELLEASTASTQTCLPIPQESRQVIGDWSNDVSA